MHELSHSLIAFHRINDLNHTFAKCRRPRCPPSCPATRSSATRLLSARTYSRHRTRACPSTHGNTRPRANTSAGVRWWCGSPASEGYLLRPAGAGEDERYLRSTTPSFHQSVLPQLTDSVQRGCLSTWTAPAMLRKPVLARRLASAAANPRRATTRNSADLQIPPSWKLDYPERNRKSPSSSTAGCCKGHRFRPSGERTYSCHAPEQNSLTGQACVLVCADSRRTAKGRRRMHAARSAAAIEMWASQGCREARQEGGGGS
ncbi:hypothetical protein B0T14DRAFT_503931 [Immersiella caudata]|uniref:Uncharacterized protein n=1 Tax=Immersiella caudata TaxID=314043 RepID=A0AA40CBI1_9PEZI|nr:hypothetical protein B0T14DRAFT_503931 [Immersiella caudata]